jgi:hypothetical protein
MSALSIQPTYPIFTDIDGQPLEAGYVWLGTANLDPQTNPITVYWDAALTILAPQPIRTLGGYPSRNGTPARLYVNSDYSIRVMNKNGSSVYSAPATTERYSDIVITGINAEDVVYDPPFVDGVQTNVERKLEQTLSLKDLGAVGDGVTDDYVATQNAASDANSVEISDGVYKLSQQVVMAIPKSFVGNGATTRFEAQPGFTGSIFRISPAAGTDPKGWTVSDFEVTNNGNATNVFLLDIASAGEYISKFTLSKIISNTQVSNYFVELLNSIPNIDGLFTSYFSDNWSFGGYYLENAGDSIYLERNTTTGAGVGYYVNQLGTAANITIRDGNCTSAGGALNMVKGQNLTFENMQVECPVAFTGVNNAAVSIDRPSGGVILNTKIINNNINTQGNPFYCIYVDNAVQTVIDGNELYCDVATGAHIYIDSGARDTIIGNNKYYNRATGAETAPIIVNNGIGTFGFWNNATILLAGWTSQGATENPLGYFKDRDGTVHLRGRVAGAAAAAGSLLFTLPIGFRPNVKNYQMSTFGAVSFVRDEVIFLIASTGNVTIITNNATALDLNNISFSVR